MVKTLICGLNEKSQLTTKSSDLQSDRQHTELQVNHLFLDHLTSCSYRYIYACVHKNGTETTTFLSQFERQWHSVSPAQKEKHLRRMLLNFSPVLCLLFQPCTPITFSS